MSCTSCDLEWPLAHPFTNSFLALQAYVVPNSLTLLLNYCFLQLPLLFRGYSKVSHVYSLFPQVLLRLVDVTQPLHFSYLSTEGHTHNRLLLKE